MNSKTKYPEHDKKYYDYEVDYEELDDIKYRKEEEKNASKNYLSFLNPSSFFKKVNKRVKRFKQKIR